jgi:3-oxoacyl-[acyl-carrier protein] reductase
MGILESKKIIVTGGTRGIGRATVEYLHEQGASVAFTHTARDPEAQLKAEAWAAELSKSGAAVKAFTLNLSETGQFKEKVGQILEFLGSLDGLVNNAGISSDQLILRMKEEDFDSVINVNLKGAYFFTKECLRPLMKAESGSIVFMSSVVGLMGNTGQSAYSASKAALIGLTKSLARELASRSLRVNAVAPGFIESDMTARLGDDLKESFLGQIPLKRFGQTKEVAYGVGYLLSDMSRYVTGQTLNINGGLYI